MPDSNAIQPVGFFARMPAGGTAYVRPDADQAALDARKEEAKQSILRRFGRMTEGTRPVTVTALAMLSAAVEEIAARDAVRLAPANQPGDEVDQKIVDRVAEKLHDMDCAWNGYGHGINQANVDAKYQRWAATLASMGVLADPAELSALRAENERLRDALQSEENAWQDITVAGMEAKDEDQSAERQAWQSRIDALERQLVRATVVKLIRDAAAGLLAAHPDTHEPTIPPASKSKHREYLAAVAQGLPVLCPECTGPNGLSGPLHAAGCPLARQEPGQGDGDAECPNTPRCEHPAMFHDISGDPEDPQPMCCADGCPCGRPAAEAKGDGGGPVMIQRNKPHVLRWVDLHGTSECTVCLERWGPEDHKIAACPGAPVRPEPQRERPRRCYCGGPEEAVYGHEYGSSACRSGREAHRG